MAETQAKARTETTAPVAASSGGALGADGDDGLQTRLEAILAGAVDALSLGGAAIRLLSNARDSLHTHLAVDEAGRKVRADGGGDGDPVIAGSPMAHVLSGQSLALITDSGEGGASVPLRVDSQIIGVLSALAAPHGPSVGENLKSLGAFANQAAYAIGSARADALREAEARRERTLSDVSRAIASSLSPTQILAHVAELMAKGVEAEHSAVYVWEMDLNQLRRKADCGVSARASRKFSAIPFVPELACAQHLAAGEPVSADRNSEDAQARAFADAIDSPYGLAIPLISKNRLIAIAIVSTPPGLTEFDPDDVQLLTAIASQAAISIENATLYDAQHRAVTELAALYAVSQALVVSPDLTDRLHVVAQSISAVTGVSRCGVFLIEDTRARGHLIIGVSDEERESFRRLRLPLSERETAMMQAIKLGKPTVIERRAGLRDGYIAAKWRVKRMLAVPLIFEGRTVGLAAADEPGQFARFGENAIKVTAAIGEQAAIAIQHARLFEQTRRHAEDLGVLWEAGQALSSELGLEDLLDTLQEHLRRLPGVAAASVMVRNWDGTLQVTRAPGVRVRYKTPGHVSDPCDRQCLEALSSPDAMVSRGVRRHSGCVYPELAHLESAEFSILSIPMIQRGQTLGLINVMAGGDHDFSTGEVRLIGSLTSMAAAAVARAQLYERERRIAETFQRSFLPAVPEEFGGFEIAHHYAAALEEARVGGDFYDVFPLNDGARLGLVIGDVSGKGLDAAVHTAMAKYFIRAYSFNGCDAGEVLSRANDALCYYVPASLFVTLFFGVLDVESGELSYANAGHELPLQWRQPVGRFSTLACTGRALGFLPGCDYITEQTVLEPGDVLILYTDGVSEARKGKEFFNIAGIRRAAGKVVGEGAAKVAEAVETSVREYTGGRLRDDIALLVARRRVE